MKTLLHATALIVLFAASAPAQTPITAHICCGAQGILDHDWQVEVTVNCAGQDVKVTVHVPKYSDSEAIAGAVANKLNQATGRKDFDTRETENPKSDPKTGEDFILPQDCTIKSVVTKKRLDSGWVVKDDHLKFYDGAEQLNNPDDEESP